MAVTLLPDNPQTVRRLESVACLLEWIRSMPATDRQSFVGALAECGDAIKQVVDRLLAVVKDPTTTANERERALTIIADALTLNSERDRRGVIDFAPAAAGVVSESPPLAREVRNIDTQEATFATRLREVMESKRISQSELAERIGCSQPAISQMLNRNCRPQKRTILKLAEALNVQACDLWPDIEVAEMLDHVAGFQQDDYVMTEAEARALSDTSSPNRPKIQPKSLPIRRR